MSITREKYKKAKNQSKALKNMLDESEVTKTEKLFEIATLQEELNEKDQQITKLLEDVERWKSLSERLPDDGEIEDLHRTIKKQNKLIDTLEKQIPKLESGKDMLLFQIKTLEETRNDLKSQLIELKKENRELKRLEPLKKEN